MSGAPRFELTMSLPTDPRFAETARELAVFAARQAGCSETRAHAFGEEMQEIVRSYLQAAGADGSLPIVVRLTTGPVEVLVDGRTFSLTP